MKSPKKRHVKYVRRLDYSIQGPAFVRPLSAIEYVHIKMNSLAPKSQPIDQPRASWPIICVNRIIMKTTYKFRVALIFGSNLVKILTHQGWKMDSIKSVDSSTLDMSFMGV